MQLTPLKSPYLISILLLFLLKGTILAVLMPLFQNPDEQLHYATIQYLAEPAVKDWPLTISKQKINIGSDISTYGFSEETIRTAQATQFDEVKFENQNIQNFSDPNKENDVLQSNWKHYIDAYPTNVSGTKSVYYLFASWLEQFFSGESIFIRTFTIRLLSVLFGLGIIILGYLTTRKIGFSDQASLLFAALLAFQPMLSITGAQINIDIALIFSFSFFLYTGASLLTDGLRWKPVILALFSAVLGFFSKGPGIILVGTLYPLFSWCTYQKINFSTKKFLIGLLGVSALLAAIAFFAIPKNYIVSITNFTAQSKFHSPFESIGKYFEKTLTTGELRDTALSYWGHFGWLDHAIPEWSLSLIVIVSITGFLGTFWYLFSQKNAPYLPERKYLVFFLGMIAALQVAIRFYDWRVFDYTGQILIGQPGRYFLPNIIAHLLIIATGIGFLLRQEKHFLLAMKTLTLSMILLQLHAIVNVIIPRYYL